jgi:hypothetical protein
MKLIILILLLGSSLNSFSNENEEIPPMNRVIVDYVNSVMGTQVDRGECWDIANRALKLADAKWDGMYKYGKPVDYMNEPIFPGDIIHFQGVVIKQVQGFSTITETMEQHTAIILKVYGKGIYELAHQNTSFSGRKVGKSPIDLNGLQKGTVIVYRPVK